MLLTFVGLILIAAAVYANRRMSGLLGRLCFIICWLFGILLTAFGALDWVAGAGLGNGIASNIFVAALPFLIPLAIYAGVQILGFYTSTYAKITGNSIIKVYADKGLYGEYLIYRRLKKLEANGAKFLFNVYVPKADGQTTEIDVLMIDEYGLFVFESKNYSGWIFGDDKHQSWTQTLPAGRKKANKEHFYNPIWQNRGHIAALEALVGEVRTWSIITFSERCELKNVSWSEPDVRVIKRNRVYRTVGELTEGSRPTLTAGQVEGIWQFLYPYSQTDAQTKKQHVQNVQKYQRYTGKH